MATWQKIIVISMAGILGAIIGYICLKPNLKNTNDNISINNSSNTTNNVIDQYVYK